MNFLNICPEMNFSCQQFSELIFQILGYFAPLIKVLTEM